MGEGEFQIVFRGEITGDHPLETVKQQIAALFRMTPERVETLFTGKPVVIKRGVDEATAGKFRQAFRNAGAVCEVRPEGNETAGSAQGDSAVHTGAQSGSSQQSSSGKGSAHTGSIALAGDPNQTIRAMTAPETTSELTLDDSEEPLTAPGTTEPPAIDTSELDIADPEAGPLSQQSATPPAEIDTGDLQMEPLETDDHPG